ncbi:carcinoembryonic antigen-related cell adhesion molecule 3-like [Anolis sagrei]|uniref:carcinoembryonic antigen-related cell adhesion molecule 3-like n=1 Tax=Anolis sagrei TaxID=38937 RepID=UPI003522DD49
MAEPDGGGATRQSPQVAQHPDPQRAQPAELQLPGRGFSIRYVLLFCCSGSAQVVEILIPVTSEPWLPLVGSEVTIIPSGDVANVSFCFWYRGVDTNATLIFRYTPPPGSRYFYGKAFTGRERMKQHCSLHITNLTMEDIGYYYVRKERGVNMTSEHGSMFLLIGDNAPRGELSGKAATAIVIATLIGIMGVVALTMYRSSRATPET